MHWETEKFVGLALLQYFLYYGVWNWNYNITEVCLYTCIRSLEGVLQLIDVLHICHLTICNSVVSVSFTIIYLATCSWILFESSNKTVKLLEKSLIPWILTLRFVRQDQGTLNSRANTTPCYQGKTFWSTFPSAPWISSFPGVPGQNRHSSQPSTSNRHCSL